MKETATTMPIRMRVADNGSEPQGEGGGGADAGRQ
jgi:hypothetical protein